MRERERERTAHRERMLGRQGHLSGKMNLLCLAFTTSSRTRRSLSPFSFHETGPDWRAINPFAFTRQCIEICAPKDVSVYESRLKLRTKNLSDFNLLIRTFDFWYLIIEFNVCVWANEYSLSCIKSV